MELKNYFGNLKKGQKPEIKKVKEAQKNPVAKIKFKKTDQTHLILGVRAFDQFNEKRFALSLLSIILGGNMSSRLFIEVRERLGLAYYVRTGAELFDDCGYIATQAGVEHKNLELTVKTILREYEKISAEGVTEKELQKAKDYVKGKGVMGLEASDETAMFLIGQEVSRGEMLSPKELFAKIDKVTTKDVLSVAKEIFRKNKLNLAIIGPHKNEKKLQALLKL
jgi:predicted Zn-dependent peptidase